MVVPIAAAIQARPAQKARKAKRVKEVKPPKPRRVPRRLRVKAPRPPRRETNKRWRRGHVVAIVSAPLILLAGGGFAYFWLSRPESVAVPNVVHRDVFTAAATLQKAGFDVDSIITDNPQPGGMVLAQNPRRGSADEGSTVTITISDVVATVPDVVGTPVDSALASLRRVGFVNLPVTDDFRDDFEPGTVVGVTPTAFSEAKKADPVTVSVARDPHVTVPNLVSARPGHRYCEAPAARPRCDREDREQ